MARPANVRSFNPEFIENVKQYYIAHDLSLDAIARESHSLFGREITSAALKLWASEGDWAYERAQNAIANAGTRKEQIEKVLDQAFALLISPEVIGNPSAWSSIANTYFSGISKVGGSVDRSSQKTDLHQVLEGMDIVSKPE